jgi:hypothetical protein
VGGVVVPLGAFAHAVDGRLRNTLRARHACGAVRVRALRPWARMAHADRGIVVARAVVAPRVIPRRLFSGGTCRARCLRWIRDLIFGNERALGARLLAQAHHPRQTRHTVAQLRAGGVIRTRGSRVTAEGWQTGSVVGTNSTRRHAFLANAERRILPVWAQLAPSFVHCGPHARSTNTAPDAIDPNLVIGARTATQRVICVAAGLTWCARVLLAA